MMIIVIIYKNKSFNLYHPDLIPYLQGNALQYPVLWHLHLDFTLGMCGWPIWGVSDMCDSYMEKSW